MMSTYMLHGAWFFDMVIPHVYYSLGRLIGRRLARIHQEVVKFGASRQYSSGRVHHDAIGARERHFLRHESFITGANLGFPAISWRRWKNES